MSVNKRYYWYKMKTDFFEEMIIKFLKMQKKGDTMILLFQQIMLYALKTDGYLYYKKMMPTFEEELALAIGAKPSIIKDLLNILITYEAVKKVDENTYYIKMLEDCVGSETKAAERMRKKRSEQCSLNSEICPPEIEKEIETEKSKIREEKKPSAFSDEKKSGRFSNKSNFYKNDYKPKRSASYDIDEIVKKINTEELVYKKNE